MELKDKLNEIKELSHELQNKIDELSEELGEEEEKDKIELLDEYMKTLDERLFVEKSISSWHVRLHFTDGDATNWTLSVIDVDTGEVLSVQKNDAPTELFNELLKYKYAFKGKYDELFKEDDND